MGDHAVADAATRKSRRRFLGLEPVYESGRALPRARSWAVEDELVAVTLLGDVTIDLSETASAPPAVEIAPMRMRSCATSR